MSQRLHLSYWHKAQLVRKDAVATDESHRAHIKHSKRIFVPIYPHIPVVDLKPPSHSSFSHLQLPRRRFERRYVLAASFPLLLKRRGKTYMIHVLYCPGWPSSLAYVIDSYGDYHEQTNEVRLSCSDHQSRQGLSASGVGQGRYSSKGFSGFAQS